jgi:predicted permease
VQFIRILAWKIRGLFGGSRLNDDLDEELRSHLDMLTAEYINKGMTEENARREARRSFGGVTQTREAYLDQRGLPIVETILQDLRYGVRMLRKNPGFTAVAVLTLALGIGANTAIFSVIDAVMIKTLPVKDPNRLVLVNWTSTGWPGVMDDLEGSDRKDPATGNRTSESVPYQVFEDLHSRAETLSEVFAFAANINGFNVQFEGKPLAAATEPVSGNYFNGLGVQTIIGRPILPDDDSPSAAPIAVVSYNFWKSKLGGDESAIGKPIVINNLPLTLVGVAPPEFFGTQPGESNDLWVTLSMFPRLVKAFDFGDPSQKNSDPEVAAAAFWKQPTVWWLIVMGRIKPGVSEQQVLTETSAIFSQTIDSMIKSEKQGKNRPSLGLGAGNKGLDFLRREFSEPLFVLMGAVGLVLLIACANVAGLLISRATSRQKEFAVRLSLGARRMRLIQQLLTESLLLALIGGALGLLLSRWMTELLITLVESGGQGIKLPVTINVRLLGFNAGVAIITGILFGLLPALSATRIGLTAALKEGGSRQGSRRSRLARALVAAQVALSLVLLVGAGLFLRTLQKLQDVPLGFEKNHLLMFRVKPGLNGYKGASLYEYYRQVRERIAAIPGVSSVSFSTHGPVGDGMSSTNSKIPGVLNNDEQFDFHRHLIGPGYCEAVGIPLLAGRTLDERDTAAGPKVAVINQTFARNAFHDVDPIGKVLRFGKPENPKDYEIVGIVGDAKYGDLRKNAPPTAYFSYLQDSASFMTFQVRTRTEPGSIVAALRSEVAEVDANVPITDLDLLVDRIDQALFLERMFSRLTGSFGLLALVLVCVGLYGTMSYFVARRTNEIGIRMALGARPSGVFRMVLIEGLTLTSIGVVIGLIGAAFGTKLISSSLFEVPRIDPITFSVVALLLIGVGLLACYVPARRAMKVDPMVALRYE